MNLTINSIATKIGGEIIKGMIVIISKGKIKEDNEEVIIKQGGRSWLVNLENSVHFIGASINIFFNLNLSNQFKYLFNHKYINFFNLFGNINKRINSSF